MATTALTPAATYRSSLYEWMTTTDHKKIGILYVINSFVFFFIGGLLALGVRSQLAVPANKLISADVYNQLFTMHASLMLFLFVIPMLAGFGNYAVPLMIGAPDMAFPRINALSFWMLPAGRDHHAHRLPRPGRRRGGRLDELRAAHGASLFRDGHGPVAHGRAAHRHELDPGRRQLPGHDLQDARARDDDVPDADHGLDGARDERPRRAGDAGPGQRADHAVHRPQLRRELLQPGPRRQRRPVAERVLVLLATRRSTS